jgi:hypothetical protein
LHEDGEHAVLDALYRAFDFVEGESDETVMLLASTDPVLMTLLTETKQFPGQSWPKHI